MMDEYDKHRPECPFQFAPLDVCHCVKDNMADEITRLRAENERLREALTPSADTKAAYIGEFNMGIQMSLPGGDTDYRSVQIPWTTIKEIMAAIRARAALQEKQDG